MAQLMYGHVLANGIRINYYRTGGEKPPVVLLHGLSDYGMCWGRFPVFLEPSYDVVAMDMRGHGMSDKPKSGYRYEELAADVFWVIRTLNLLKPVVIGHSMGAGTAAVLAEINPQYISGIVLEDPPWHPSSLKRTTADRENNAAEYQKTIEDYKNKSLQDIIQICKERHPNWDETEFLQWAKGKQLTSPNTAEFLRVEQRDWMDTVKNLRVPGLLLTADVERGAIVSHETAQVVEQHWKQGKAVHLPGAGHSIHREQYYKYRDEVKRFLRQTW
jgi:pimeloyl-ACP methyl ester carboxylesterase